MRKECPRVPNQVSALLCQLCGIPLTSAEAQSIARIVLAGFLQHLTTRIRTNNPPVSKAYLWCIEAISHRIDTSTALPTLTKTKSSPHASAD